MSTATHPEDPVHLDLSGTARGASEADQADPSSGSVGTDAAPQRRKSRSKRSAAESAVTEPAKTTKTTALITLLAADGGADIASLSAALGWLPHTTRAALTRLRQAEYALEAIAPMEGGAKRYRIIASPQVQAST